MEGLNRVNNPGRKRGFGAKKTEVAVAPARHFFSDVVSLQDDSFKPSGSSEEITPSMELLPDAKYYEFHLGFDKETYEFYKKMVARTLDFSAAYLDAETNAPAGYQPFFA